jgi:predicted cupin superfamily sugar epimerase
MLRAGSSALIRVHRRFFRVHSRPFVVSRGMSGSLTADEVIRLLQLEAHPEGGYYRETFRDSTRAGERSASTAIYFLLKEGEISRWHRIDSVEVWHWYGGAPIRLQIRNAEGPVETVLLGSDLLGNERPQAVVPAHAWQTAETLGAWTLVGCTVAPGFEFAGFQLL